MNRILNHLCAAAVCSMLSALLLTSCSGAKAVQPQAAEVSGAGSTVSSEAGSSEDTAVQASVSSDTDTVSTAADPAEEAAAADESAAAAEPALRDLYAMETFDEVPDYMLSHQDGVDYGTVLSDVKYWSRTAEDYKYCNILLPAGYDENEEYPVLYMIHGWGGRYDSHIHESSIIETIYGNLLSEGRAVPMIIVGVDMYTDILDDKDDKTDAEMRICYDKNVDDIALDLMPFIEENFPVKKGRLNTAVSGVSEGATNCLAIGFKWQDRIGYIGSLAPCVGVIPTPFGGNSYWSWPILDDLVIESPDTMPRYIYLTVGTEDPYCIRSTAYYGEVMDDHGIPNQNDLVEGYGHGNDMWALGHYNFLQKIFQE